MMRRFSIISPLLLLFFVGCGKSDEAQMQETVIEAVKAQSVGDVERYLQYADFGEELNSLHICLLQSMLIRHKTVVDRKGGVADVVPKSSTPENDSLAFMSYSVSYHDGTQEQKIATLVKKDGCWKVSVK